MRVVVGERMGGPEVLAVAEREAPRPGPGEVVVDVAAAGVNYMDIYQREGVGNYRADPPFGPGGGGAGQARGGGGGGAGHGGPRRGELQGPARGRSRGLGRPGEELRRAGRAARQGRRAGA